MKCLKKLRGDLEVDLFRALKCSIILLKSKMFLCNVAFLHPPATANFFEVCAGFRNLDINTCFLSYGFEEKYDFEKGGGGKL